MRDHCRAVGAAIRSKLGAEDQYGFEPRPEQRLPHAPAKRIHRTCRRIHSDTACLDQSLSHPGRILCYWDTIPYDDSHTYGISSCANNCFIGDNDKSSYCYGKPYSRIHISSIHPVFNLKTKAYKYQWTLCYTYLYTNGTIWIHAHRHTDSD